jgi:hypothetical protein
MLMTEIKEGQYWLIHWGEVKASTVYYIKSFRDSKITADRWESWGGGPYTGDWTTDSNVDFFDSKPGKIVIPISENQAKCLLGLWRLRV